MNLKLARCDSKRQALCEFEFVHINCSEQRLRRSTNIRSVMRRRTDCNTNYSLPASCCRTIWYWCICTYRTAQVQL